jgi:5,10-methylenetetrahydromethanopterin reductase
MRETILVLRRLLNMERVSFHGEYIHVEGIKLDVVHHRREPRRVPIYISATGMKMMELTGKIADGVVLNYCVPPEYNDNAFE